MKSLYVCPQNLYLKPDYLRIENQYLSGTSDFVCLIQIKMTQGVPGIADAKAINVKLFTQQPSNCSL
jgi:hypothetical protein